ncbi:MAG: AAA family ATPase [Rubrivivax sp.]|nr:AAA family ATPase [Rubrivivax sp.]
MLGTPRVQVREPRWAVRLLGAVQAVGPGQTITHWPSRAVAALLARLALAPDRSHPREELIELLWPGVSLDVGRNRLRQALSSLKSLLEPPGAQRVPVLDADRSVVRVVSGALYCDAHDLERRVRGGEPLAAATARELGELMPGFYDEWVLEERSRLSALFEPVQRGAVSAAEAERSRRTAAEARASATLPVEALSPLPSYLTRTFGVELSEASLCALVTTQRLVTVHGPGGSGKTRLAVEVARSLREQPNWMQNLGESGQFERVAFVPLLACTRADEVLEAIAEALRAVGAGGPRTRIQALLAGRRVLLVLDNAEQLLPQGDAAIAEVLAALPGVHALVTSRRRLGLDGEATFELDGLPLPTTGAAWDEVATNSAVALLVDRARATGADFSVSERNAEAIATLLRLLGGMPLAIELAASRVRAFTPQELVQRLRESAGSPMLDLLSRPRTSASPDARHASMRHMVEWSWRQLRPEQAALLATLSVFTAPARLEAVAFVAPGDAAAVGDGIDELSELSLLHSVRDDSDVVRHALLQPVREYAAERHGAEQARATRARLRQWLTLQARSAMPTRPAAMAGEARHVHGSLTSAPADGAYREALELAVAMRPFWESEMLPMADILALEAALAQVDDPVLRGETLELLAYARLCAGFAAEAMAHAEAARATPLDDRQRSLVLSRWAHVRYGAGLHDAEIDHAIDEALALAERCADPAAAATALRLKGLMASNIRLDYAGSEVLMARAQALWEQMGNQRMAYARLRDRVTMWAWLGREEEAAGVLRECEVAALADADGLGAMLAARQLGRVCIRMRRWADAAAAFRRAVRLAWERQNALELTVALMHLPDALVNEPGQVELAARLQGFARPQWARLFGTLNCIEQRELRRTRRLLRLRLGGARAEALRVEGIGWTLPAAVARALESDVEAG